MSVHMTGYLCHGKYCISHAIQEYEGFCGACWVKLSPKERAIAQGKESPVVLEHRVEIHRARNRLLVVLLWLWGAAMTAGVALMAWRMR